MCQIYYAKSVGEDGKQQKNRRHLEQVAALAEHFGEEIGMPLAAWICGLLHDFGKYSVAFQRVLAGTATGIDHAICGAVFLYAAKLKKRGTLAYRMAAAAIAAHHSALRSYDSLVPELEDLLTGGGPGICATGKRAALFGQEEYLTARGFDVGITAWEDGRWEISFTDGDVYINLSLNGADEALARRAADCIDFAALCSRGGIAGEILGLDRSPGANPEAAEAYEELYSSPEFQGSMYFTLWFREVFYGSTFTGVYGQEGYEDIDAQMDLLREKYGLVPAVSKTEAQRTEYSNGAWYLDAGDYNLHYIPKGALYTRLEYFAPFSEYSMIWSYDTAGGARVYCACDGPEKRSCAHVLYETDGAWVLLNMHTLDVWEIQRSADSIDWSEFK